MSRANLGPLTTVYIPPTSCFTPRVEAYPTTVYVANYGQICRTSERYIYYVAEPCYPPPLESTLSEAWDRSAYTFVPIFSPGLSCPSGWMSACTVTRSESEASPLSTGIGYLSHWANLKPGETAVGCCPRGYLCHETDGNLCTSDASSGQVVSGTMYDSRCAAIETSFTIKTSLKTENVGNYYGYIGYAYRVMLVRSVPTSLERLSKPTSGSPSQPTSDPGITGPSTKHFAGLSSGAKIAIGVTIPVFVIVAAIVVFLLWYRCLQQQRSHRDLQNGGQDQPEHATSSGTGAGAAEKPELEASHGVAFGSVGREVTEKPELEAKLTGVVDFPPASTASAQLLSQKLNGRQDEYTREIDSTAAARPASQKLENIEQRPLGSGTSADIKTMHKLETARIAGPPRQEIEYSPAPPEAIHVNSTTFPSQPFSSAPWKWAEPLEGSHPSQPSVATENRSVNTTQEGNTGRLAELRAEESRLEARIARMRDLVRLEDDRARVVKEIQRIEEEEQHGPLQDRPH